MRTTFWLGSQGRCGGFGTDAVADHPRLPSVTHRVLADSVSCNVRRAAPVRLWYGRGAHRCGCRTCTCSAAIGCCDAHGGRRAPCPPGASAHGARGICVATPQPRVLRSCRRSASRIGRRTPPRTTPPAGSGAEHPGNRGRTHPIPSAPQPGAPRQNHFVGRSPGSKPSTWSKRSSRSGATCHSPAYSRLAKPSSKRCSNTASNGCQKPATSSRTIGLRW
jgi:hypothetical protein